MKFPDGWNVAGRGDPIVGPACVSSRIQAEIRPACARELLWDRWRGSASISLFKNVNAAGSQGYYTVNSTQRYMVEDGKLGLCNFDVIRRDVVL